MKYSLPVLAGIVGFLSITAPAFAAQEDFVEALKTCRNNTSIVQRSQCYDNTLEDYDLITLQKKSTMPAQGNWKIDIRKSTLVDATNVTLTLPARERFTNTLGAEVLPSLVLACVDGRPNAYISWSTAIGKTEGRIVPDALVNARLGSSPVISERWVTSSDQTASFIPNPPEFYKKLLQMDGLFAIKIWPNANYDTITSSFDAKGLDQKFASLKAACKLP